MNLDTARNEIKNPARVTAQWMLVEAAVFVAIAATAVLLVF